MSNIREIILLNIVFPLADFIMGTCAIRWYRQICMMNKWSRKEVVDWQNKQLQAFIRHAYEHTVYYRRVMDKLGIKSEDIRTADDLSKLPIINKNIVRNHFLELIPDDIDKYRFRKSRTGGTTGEPMYYYCDENTWGYVTAAKIYNWKRSGYRYGDAFLALGSSSLFPDKKNKFRKVYDLMRREYGKNGMNMSDEICAEYIMFLKRRRVEYIYGYASAVFLLAKYVIDKQLDLSFVKCVFTTSEILLPEYRQRIEQAFGCLVMDCYGAKDAGITAFESESGLYQIGYNVIAETVENDEFGEGKLLTTNFVNYAFPLIRYDFGDEAKIGIDDSYNGQVIYKIYGRTSDVIRLINGNNITGPGFTILMKHFDVVAYEIRQNGPSSVLLRIQPDKEKYNREQESQIISKFRCYLGEGCNLDVEYVDKFEPLSNGKRNYFLNNYGK